MSVAFARAVVDGLRHNSVDVRFPRPSWESAGNGQTSAYEGLIIHHTASAFGNAPPILWNGRSDLSGPLANSAGNADGSVSMIAAHPANHAGASGGKSMGPLTTTRAFNKLVWGHEIVYPGTVPMTAAQYRTSCILGAVITGILKRPTPEWCRAHAETSITGKWDPGFAPNRTINMGAYRNDVDAFVTGAPLGEQDMPLTNEDIKAIWTYPVGNKYGNPTVWAGDLIAWSDFHSGKGRASIDSVVIPTLARLEAKMALMGAPDIDEAALAAIVVRQMEPIITKIVLDVMGKENEAQAVAIVNALGAKLAQSTQ